VAALKRLAAAIYAAGASAGALGVACRQAETVPAESKEPAAAASALAAPAEGPSAEFHDATFDLVIRPVGEYAAGVAATAEIVLTPKGEYHCNEKYPYKLKVSASPGVRYVAPVIGMDAVTIEPSRAVLRVGFTPETPGGKTLGGQLSFSVCGAARCLIEKRNLALAISVK